MKETIYSLIIFAWIFTLFNLGSAFTFQQVSQMTSIRSSQNLFPPIHHHFQSNTNIKTSSHSLTIPNKINPTRRNHAHLSAVSPAAAASIMTKFHSDPTFVLSITLLLSTFGIALEKNTFIGKALSAPLATMALALIVANVGIIPFTSPVYDFINRYLVALAVPLLLFDSDLKKCISETGSLLLAFIIGAISTIVGTIAAYILIPLTTSLGIDTAWKVSSALAARHIGGAINFVAVAETLGLERSVVSASIAADNVVVALYFAFLFYLAKPGEDGNVEGKEGASSDEVAMKKEGEMNTVPLPRDPEDVSSTPGESGISLSTLASSITLSSCFVTLGKILTRALLPSGTSALPLISILTVAGVTAFPSFFSNLSTTGTALGIIFVQMFLAASGAAGSIQLVIQSAPLLFLFATVQLAVHFMSLMGLGKLIFRLKSRELYLASNANVGGPTTAAAMATAKDWPRLVLPALLVGILGYSFATPIALTLGQLVLKRLNPINVL